MTITEFLLARIAEDVADALTPPEHYAPFECEWLWCPKARTEPLGDLGGPDDDCTCGVDQWEPGRPLRECEAKRRIVERSEFLVSEGAYPDLTRRERSWTLTTLCVLAAVYADHPDYDPTWSV